MVRFAGFIRDQYRRHAPTKEELQRSRLLKPLGKRIWASELWRFTRRRAAGRPVGLFVGIFLDVPGLQIVGCRFSRRAISRQHPHCGGMTSSPTRQPPPFS